VADPQLAVRLQIQLGSLADHIESIEESRLPAAKATTRPLTLSTRATSAPDAWPIPRDKPMADTRTVAEMNLAVGWSCILRLLRMNRRHNGNVPLRREA
jgi:hypothetical protein